MRRVAGLVCVVLSLGAVACGGGGDRSADPASDEAFARTLRFQEAVADARLRFARAEGAGDLDGMRAALDDFTSAVVKSQAAAGQIEDDELRRLFSHHAMNLRELADAVDERLRYHARRVEDRSFVRDRAYERDIAKRASEAALRAERSGTAVVDALVPERHRAEFDEALEGFQAELDAAYE